MFMHRIKLKNVLSYGPSGLDLELKPLNVLIGPNGSGKSNLIEVVGLLKAAATDLQKPIREGGGVINWVWRGEPKQSGARVEAVISGDNDRLLEYCLAFHGIDQRFHLHFESLCEVAGEQNPDPFPYFVGDGNAFHLYAGKGTPTGRSQPAITVKPSNLGQSVLSSIKGPEYPQITYTGERINQIRLYRDWTFGRKTPLRSPLPADLPNDELQEDGANLGLVLNRLKRDAPKAADQVLKELRRLYEGIEAIDVSIEGGTVQLFLREGDVIVPATRLSDGTLRYICLLAILCHPSPPPLVCLEEPELGLHPDLLPGLADLLRRASTKCQLIVTTHSDALVDNFTDAPDNVLICEKHDGQTQLNRLNSDDLAEWLSHCSLGELWTKGELGGNRW